VRLLAYGREVLNKSRVVAIVLPSNTASVALIKKIGCQFEKMMQMPNDPEALALYSVAL